MSKNEENLHNKLKELQKERAGWVGKRNQRQHGSKEYYAASNKVGGVDKRIRTVMKQLKNLSVGVVEDEEDGVDLTTMDLKNFDKNKDFFKDYRMTPKVKDSEVTIVMYSGVAIRAFTGLTPDQDEIDCLLSQGLNPKSKVKEGGAVRLQIYDLKKMEDKRIFAEHYKCEFVCMAGWVFKEYTDKLVWSEDDARVAHGLLFDRTDFTSAVRIVYEYKDGNLPMVATAGYMLLSRDMQLCRNDGAASVTHQTNGPNGKFKIFTLVQFGIVDFCRQRGLGSVCLEVCVS